MAVLGDELQRYTSTRKLAKVSDETYPNDVMLPIVTRADNNMKKATGKTDWVSTDTYWESALKISDYFGAIEIMDSLPNKNGDDLREALSKELAIFNQTDEATKAPSTLAVVGEVNIQNDLYSGNYTKEQTLWG